VNTYLFYSNDGWTQAPDGADLENCQLLGTSSAASYEDALSALLKENTWIKEHKYTISNIKAYVIAQ